MKNNNFFKRIFNIAGSYKESPNQEDDIVFKEPRTHDMFRDFDTTEQLDRISTLLKLDENSQQDALKLEIESFKKRNLCDPTEELYYYYRLSGLAKNKELLKGIVSERLLEMNRKYDLYHEEYLLRSWLGDILYKFRLYDYMGERSFMEWLPEYRLSKIKGYEENHYLDLWKEKIGFTKNTKPNIVKDAVHEANQISIERYERFKNSQSWNVRFLDSGYIEKMEFTLFREDGKYYLFSYYDLSNGYRKNYNVFDDFYQVLDFVISEREKADK